MTEKYTFSSLKYERPDFKALIAKTEELTEKMKKAESYEEARRVYFEMEENSAHLSTMANIAHIRHTIDTRDEFYEKETEFINDSYPTAIPSSIAFDDAVFESPFKGDFEKEFGKALFTGMELQKKSFCEENIPLMQQESKLTNEYQKIMATAAIEFDGQTLNLYGIEKYFEDDDRETRRAAVKAYSNFYHSHEDRLEEIWDELIKIRNQMGKNLGFENYIPLGYMNQGRTDYGQKEVESYRNQVLRELVPLCQELYKAQEKRLGIDSLKFYDEKRIYADGNAIPAGDDDYLMEKAKEMYHKLSDETGEFIDCMMEHELFDLKNKPGKASTGYMTTLEDYKVPFVFSCFNQTIGDIQVLTHEMGHAFAGYEAMKNQPITSYYMESTDIAEIHSMGMEQFCYPYAELFFGDQADKFRFAHLQEAITFVPFGVAVDEFQHICYANPELTPKERTLEWKKLEEKYMPWRSYDQDDFFDRGGYWYYKLHIYLYPFYYINYTLTTMGAMEFKTKDNEDHDKAWADYMKLCKCGGSMSYLETLKHANLMVPFEEGTVAKSCALAKEILLKEINK